MVMVVVVVKVMVMMMYSREISHVCPNLHHFHLYKKSKNSKASNIRLNALNSAYPEGR